MNLRRIALASVAVALIVVPMASAEHEQRGRLPFPGQPVPFPQVQPVVPQLQPRIGFQPGIGIGRSPQGGCVNPLPIDRRGLERNVEYTIKRAFGPWIDDVDVDINLRKRKAEVEVELENCNPQIRFQVARFVHSLPQLRGFFIDLEIDD